MVKETLSSVAIGGKKKPTYTEGNNGAHYYVFSKDLKDLSIYDEAITTVKIPAKVNLELSSKYPRTAFISLGIGSAGVDGNAVDIGITSDDGKNWYPIVGDGRKDTYHRFKQYQVANPNTAMIVAAPVDSTHVRINVEFYDLAGKSMGTPCWEVVEVTKTTWTRYHRFASLFNNDQNLSNDGTCMTDGVFMSLYIHHKTSGYMEWGIPTQMVEYAWIVGPGLCSVTNLTTTSENFSINNNGG